MKTIIIILLMLSSINTVFSQRTFDTIRSYLDDNKIRSALPKGSNKVIFFGDSITEWWNNFFPGKPYVNRGTAGQTTIGMLNRFIEDVCELQPEIVVMLGGINDLLDSLPTEIRKSSKRNS